MDFFSYVLAEKGVTDLSATYSRRHEPVRYRNQASVPENPFVLLIERAYTRSGARIASASDVLFNRSP